MNKRLISVIHLTLEVDDTPKNRATLTKLYDGITNAVTKRVAEKIEGPDRRYVNNWHQFIDKDRYLAMVNMQEEGKPEKETFHVPEGG